MSKIEKSLTPERARIVVWEYCAIYGMKGSEGWIVSDERRAVQYFTPDGVRAELDDWADPNVIAKKIASLSAQGWEMVGVVNLDRDHHAIYFKRPV
jgi:hypothetical protein